MLDDAGIPKHVAIIMDGNGRWAKERGLSRTFGHKEGINRIKEIIKAAQDNGIEILTLFAFSTENWSRPKKEINILMRYLDDFLVRQIKDLDRNNIRFRVIGRSEPLPENIQFKIKQAEDKTKDNTGLILVLALNYGSRQEIVDGIKKAVASVVRGERKIDDIDEGSFGGFLYTRGFPDPDLLIRTSGEVRISNFLLWQLSYAELYFAKKYWPDFKTADFERAIKEYKLRRRRFGNIEAA